MSSSLAICALGRSPIAANRTASSLYSRLYLLYSLRSMRHPFRDSMPFMGCPLNVGRIKSTHCGHSGFSIAVIQFLSQACRLFHVTQQSSYRENQKAYSTKPDIRKRTEMDFPV